MMIEESIEAEEILQQIRKDAESKEWFAIFVEGFKYFYGGSFHQMSVDGEIPLMDIFLW
jgi:hypothetical protein